MKDVRRWIRARALGPPIKAVLAAESVFFAGIGATTKWMRTLMNGIVYVAFMGTARSAEQMQKKAAEHRRSIEWERSKDSPNLKRIMRLGQEARRWEAFADAYPELEAMATQLGELVAEQMFGYTSGGCGGLPGAALTGFVRKRAKPSRQLAIGVRIKSLSFEQKAAEALDIVIPAIDFFTRLALLVFLAPGGVVIMPGGVGTRLELWMWIQIVQVTTWRVPIVILDPKGHFVKTRREIAMLVQRGFLNEGQLEGFLFYATTPEEAVGVLVAERAKKKNKISI